ncbi:L-lactate dehydrogenase [Clostridium acetobutylicum]|uniref:L-lactate dehydrogenase 2 n=1 Tax=Clostridium acetobutylicum (strain ATCC 824 / DSM 792 / JCM 1419 / IAM 19013 / LMG 5710 / NBRC 13948 / NRRL B-527 / VKM B-1787 / 2291 / W) TaxID=272562 RepID=LDH2_CLOAB|nr:MULTISPECIES: L-lactate dehydrogenase [Clostridium]Q97DC6.1 RecName: Full=L-lactate dehydrogenase 2; Short=L-LDH 2 [Clostridium acetobutylicum ATCC 824]AAK81477.1 Lactate dehydrogenase [Clostridium acetobutylicum ATCC 824]ADZ22595.1 Lactate dehydrogenase [Clostridium acetobutylicum EA 2018]AWV80850.1 L-lactate dehydrogenase [Clostridium acetobutylicum]MBC2393823.1 L-lactate dehydrogenase [Clostridium acetobutylicum]MBC2584421.1 L-lactate dehydrogenase [Clostridium acetobutylicum]
MNFVKNKLVVVGAGMVGSAVLNSVLSLNLLSEVVIIDINDNKAKGEALDASHTTSFAYSPNVKVRAGNYEDCADAQIIVITAGPSLKPDDKLDRLVLADTNVKVTDSIMKNICKYTKDAIIIVVTNPVDIATYYCQNNFDYPKNKIIGTGTLLDTARMRKIIGKKYNVDSKNVHGYVLGEHGGSSFTSWSDVNIAGIPFNQLNDIFKDHYKVDKDEVDKEVRDSGIEVLKLKGYTSAGIAMSVSRLVKAMLLNEQSILPVSSTLEGEYGINDVALSIPCIITSNGIEKKLEIPLSKDEVEKLNKSADNLKSIIKGLNTNK